MTMIVVCKNAQRRLCQDLPCFTTSQYANGHNNNWTAPPERTDFDMQSKDELDNVTRRRAMGIIGVTGLVSIVGCDLLNGVDGSSGDNTGDNADCQTTPSAVEGPYFVEELLNRSDIRVDPTDSVEQPGTPLLLKVNVSKISGGACEPLAGAQVDMWHCNADGLYSDETSNGTSGKKFLRGYQITDSNGVVEFTTIYPGWYSGRTVHIHLKIRSGDTEFNSQLFFDKTTTAQVFAQSPYSSRGLPDTPNARDGIFDSDTLLTLAPEGAGYQGEFDIALRIS
jgi:protocatechuate 3,4-dioxygenase beta subunit